MFYLWKTAPVSLRHTMNRAEHWALVTFLIADSSGGVVTNRIRARQVKEQGGTRGVLYFWGAYFWRGGAYLRRETCVSKSIGLALYLEVNLPFLLCFTLYLREIFQVQAPGDLYLEGGFNGGFFCVTSLGGLYLEGLIFGILRYWLMRIPSYLSEENKRNVFGGF